MSIIFSAAKLSDVIELFDTISSVETRCMGLESWDRGTQDVRQELKNNTSLHG